MVSRSNLTASFLESREHEKIKLHLHKIEKIVSSLCNLAVELKLEINCSYLSKAASGGILASKEFAMAIGCGFLKAFGGAGGSTAAEVLLEAPDQVDPHPTVDPDPF